MTVSLAHGGAGLGAAWGEQTAVRMLHEAGFGRVDVRAVDGDFAVAVIPVAVLLFGRPWCRPVAGTGPEPAAPRPRWTSTGQRG